VYARQHVFPKLNDIDKEKIASFYSDLRAEAFRSGGQAMTARHVDSLVRLAEANARLELRQHVLPRDTDTAIGVMLESFIQSQKHQVAEELRKRFSRYVIKAAPQTDLILAVIERMFRDKLERLRASRPAGAAPPDVGEVGIEVAEIVQVIEQQEIDINEANAFMASPRFHQSFKLDGDTIRYRA